MRLAGSGIGALAFVAALLFAPAIAADPPHGHGWVRSHAAITYATMRQPGLYRVRLDRDGAERVLDTGKFKVREIVADPSNAKWISVYAVRYPTWADEQNGTAGEEKAWLYDLRSGQSLPLLEDDAAARPVISPDGSQAAWLTLHNGTWRLTVLSIPKRDQQRSRFGPVAGTRPVLSDLRWSRDGRRILFSEQPDFPRNTDRRIGWAFDPATKVFAPADPHLDRPAPEKPTHFTISACPEGAEYCSRACWDDDAVQSLALTGGLTAFMADDPITRRRAVILNPAGYVFWVP